MLTLEDPSSNICENEGTGPTPSGHTHYLNKVFKMHLVKGCGMKEWAPPYYFHIYCEECLGGYVYQFWSINSKKCNICDPLIKNCQIGVWYFMWGTVCPINLFKSIKQMQYKVPCKKYILGIFWSFCFIKCFLKTTLFSLISQCWAYSQNRKNLSSVFIHSRFRYKRKSHNRNHAT